MAPMLRCFFVLVACIAAADRAHCFMNPAALHSRQSREVALRNFARCTPACAPRVNVLATYMTIASEERTAEKQLLSPERYVVFNRFRLRNDAGPRFEQRWADRKSSLAVTEGFRFFALLKRADDVAEVDGKSKVYPTGTPDYMSMTIWETKEKFTVWRKSNAFKEAHGGGSIGGFLSALVSSFMVLQGPPSLSSWDAILPISVPAASSSIVYKGRDAEGKAVSDGINPLPEECFIAMNRFSVLPGKEGAFEKRWAERESKLQVRSQTE